MPDAAWLPLWARAASRSGWARLGDGDDRDALAALHEDALALASSLAKVETEAGRVLDGVGATPPEALLETRSRRCAHSLAERCR